MRHMREVGTPYAFVMRKGAVAPHALRSVPAVQSLAPIPELEPWSAVRPTRGAALAAMQAALPDGDVVIATTGHTGRELYAAGDRPNQLYVVGSMGCASSLGSRACHHASGATHRGHRRRWRGADAPRCTCHRWLRAPHEPGTRPPRQRSARLDGGAVDGQPLGRPRAGGIRVRVPACDSGENRGGARQGGRQRGTRPHVRSHEDEPGLAAAICPAPRCALPRSRDAFGGLSPWPPHEAPESRARLAHPSREKRIVASRSVPPRARIRRARSGGHVPPRASLRRSVRGLCSGGAHRIRALPRSRRCSDL